MAENTSIEWCDHTFNPWIGCTKVSPGCDHCYAARQDGFRRWTPEGWGGPRRRTKTWGDPVKWNAEARDLAMLGLLDRRPRVFCSSLADVFDNEVPAEWRRDLFALIAATPYLDWLLLTKRIGNASQMIAEALFPDRMTWPWPNVWLGATMVNQPEYDRDIGKLLRTPAAVHFLSIEPMLGPIDMRMGGASMPDYSDLNPLARLDWVICGGESGPGARPMHPEWARSLRDQCKAAGVPFLFKQWGEWAPGSGFALKARGYIDRAGRSVNVDAGDDFPRGAASADGWAAVHRAGKKTAGRLLDGAQHDGFPRARSTGEVQG